MILSSIFQRGCHMENQIRRVIEDGFSMAPASLLLLLARVTEDYAKRRM